MRQAIAAGKPIDVGLSYSTDIVGNFCSSGAFADLVQLHRQRDKVDLTQIPDTVLGYTEYEDVRCTMPVLADVYGALLQQGPARRRAASPSRRRRSPS